MEKESVYLNEVTLVLASIVGKIYINTLKPILIELKEKCKATFNQGHRHNLPHEVCGFFQTLPKQCERGNYALDDKENKKQDGICVKKAGCNPSLTSGLFTMFSCRLCQAEAVYTFCMKSNLVC